jgi:hypothetical protein
MCPSSTGEGPRVSARTFIKKMAVPQSHSHHDKTVASRKLMETETRGYKVFLVFITVDPQCSHS